MSINKDEHYYVGRYIGCNLHCLFSKGTIELRYFPSTLDFGYIYSWATICQTIFDYALKNGPLEPLAKILDDHTQWNKRIEKISATLSLPNSLIHFLQGEYKKYATWKQTDTDKVLERPVASTAVTTALLEQRPIPEIPAQELIAQERPASPPNYHMGYRVVFSLPESTIVRERESQLTSDLNRQLEAALASTDFLTDIRSERRNATSLTAAYYNPSMELIPNSEEGEDE